MKTHGPALAYVCSLGWSPGRMHARRHDGTGCDPIRGSINGSQTWIGRSRSRALVRIRRWISGRRAQSSQITLYGVSRIIHKKDESFSPLPQLQKKGGTCNSRNTARDRRLSWSGADVLVNVKIDHDISSMPTMGPMYRRSFLNLRPAGPATSPGSFPLPAW
jgi:hypothetical protein